MEAKFRSDKRQNGNRNTADNFFHRTPRTLNANIAHRNTASWDIHRNTAWKTAQHPNTPTPQMSQSLYC